MKDEQFSNYCTHFDVAILETINTLDGTTEHASIWYSVILPKVPFMKSAKNQNKTSLK